MLQSVARAPCSLRTVENRLEAGRGRARRGCPTVDLGGFRFRGALGLRIAVGDGFFPPAGSPLFETQGDHRVDAGGAPGGYPKRRQPDEAYHGRDEQVDSGVFGHR